MIAAAPIDEPVLAIEDLSVRFPRKGGAIAAVREASLTVRAAECVGIVGESGSGKTQIFMAAMGLLTGADVEGSVRFEGREILGSARAELNRIRGSKLTMIFQDPMTSLTPHLRIGVQLAEVLVTHAHMSWREAEGAAARMLERVRIPDPQRRMRQYPHELSGGMRQRVMIGMSLLCEPALLIADEPTTALDVTVQAQILDILRAMREELHMAVVLISHDLGVVAGIADRIIVMYGGRVVESGTTVDVLQRAEHPYTAELLKCIPDLLGPRLDRMPSLPGQPPSPSSDECGCAFAPRCPRAGQRCLTQRPLLTETREGTHRVACHYPSSGLSFPV
ncbi:MAG: ABC transporter ATP-binding protein [Pseudomonadota bacterium]|nr:ABC transporter ATP-binding protein [Pseudomonadota bacterium]